jgi:hypothetical protein
VAGLVRRELRIEDAQGAADEVGDTVGVVAGAASLDEA